MKIRTNFVSNSSSSSFVAVGIELDIEQITKDMINDSGYLVAIGTELWEGTDIIEINTLEKLMFFNLFRNYTIKMKIVLLFIKLLLMVILRNLI